MALGQPKARHWHTHTAWLPCPSCEGSMMFATLPMQHALLSNRTLGAKPLGGPQRQLTLSRATAAHLCHPTRTGQAPRGPPERQPAPAADDAVSDHGEDAEQTPQLLQGTLIQWITSTCSHQQLPLSIWRTNSTVCSGSFCPDGGPAPAASRGAFNL